MLRPVKISHGRLNQTHPLSLPDTQIITGAASITSQNRSSSPPARPSGKLVELQSAIIGDISDGKEPGIRVDERARGTLPSSMVTANMDRVNPPSLSGVLCR